MHPAVLLLALQTSLCAPAPDLQREIEDAASVAVSDAMDFDRNIASLRELRARHPDDLFANERYQDGVKAHGIEGHLKELIEQYQDRVTQAPDDVVSQYLFARALIGRNTPAAITTLTQIVADHPEFAPAQRALATIYAAPPYRDAQAAQIAQTRWQALCPASPLTPWTLIVPSPSPLLDAAERLFADNGDADRVAAMALQGIRDDEWRLQRMRPFDWFSVDDKRQAQRALLASYWRLWSLQVRCHRKAGRADQASEVLAQMQRRAAALSRSQDPLYRDAVAILDELLRCAACVHR